jgi:hypothetical protein
MDAPLQAKLSEWVAEIAFAPRLTAQMVAAFPVFWRCATPGFLAPGKFPVVLVPLLSDAGQGHALDVTHEWFEHAPQPKTVIEVIAEALLDDPAQSDFLNQAVARVLFYWTSYRKAAFKCRIADQVAGYYSAQHEALERDMVIFDLMRTPIAKHEFFNRLCKRIPLYYNVTKDGKLTNAVPEGSPLSRVQLNRMILNLLMYRANENYLEIPDRQYVVAVADTQEQLAQLHQNFDPEDFQPEMNQLIGRLQGVKFDEDAPEVRPCNPEDLVVDELRPMPMQEGIRISGSSSTASLRTLMNSQRDVYDVLVPPGNENDIT